MKNLGRIDICGIPFDIIDATVEEDDALSDCYGYCNTMQSKIVIRKGLPPELFRAILLHECQHAIWDSSGLLDFVAGKLQVDRSDVGSFEEQFIRILTPHLVKALASMKNLKAK